MIIMSKILKITDVHDVYYNCNMNDNKMNFVRRWLNQEITDNSSDDVSIDEIIFSFLSLDELQINANILSITIVTVFGCSFPSSSLFLKYDLIFFNLNHHNYEYHLYQVTQHEFDDYNNYLQQTIIIHFISIISSENRENLHECQFCSVLCNTFFLRSFSPSILSSTCGW